jgi:hypothetical protein
MKNKTILLGLTAVLSAGCFATRDGEPVEFSLPKILPRTEQGTIDVVRLIEIYQLLNPDNPPEVEKVPKDVDKDAPQVVSPEQQNPLPGQGSNQFLWKPDSHSSRGIAILWGVKHWGLGEYTQVWVNGSKFSEHKLHHPNETGVNAWRLHFFTYYSADQIPGNIVKVVLLDADRNVIDEQVIPNKNKRFEP